MVEKDKMNTGIIDLILKELKDKGLTVLLLVAGLSYFGWKERENSLLIIQENKALKEENKELRSAFYGKIIDNQNAIINTNVEILLHLKMQKNGS